MKVFISHSSSDKSRFVEDLARRLSSDGVEVWYDAWSMQPGDSLITKIFDEGLAESDCVIAVVSKASLESNWVTKELAVATIQMIERVCRVIPVLIDPVEVPMSMRDLLHLKIPDTDSYQTEYNKLLSTILNVSVAPVRGQPPGYAGEARSNGGLPPQSGALLTRLGQLALERDQELFGSGGEIEEIGSDLGLSDEDMLRELTRLQLGRLLEFEAWYGRISHIRLTWSGVLKAHDLANGDLQATRRRIVAAICNHDLLGVGELAEHCELSQLLVVSLLDELANEQRLQFAKTLGGYSSFRVASISPLLSEELS